MMVRKLSSVGLDTSTPLSLRQIEFKKAFVHSDVAQQVNLGSLRSNAAFDIARDDDAQMDLEHNFIVWLVRQVEHRVDLSMDNRPLPSEVDWSYYLSNLSRLAGSAAAFMSTSLLLPR